MTPRRRMTPRRLIAQWSDGRPRPSPSNLHRMGIFHKQLFVEGRGSTGSGKTRALTML
jgi:hypothetical protein